MKALLILPLSALMSAAPAPTSQCSPPVAVPKSVTTPNSTYYSNGEPPQRFRHPPDHPILMQFGQAAIDAMCGRPPCNMHFVGCTSADNKTMALPDPYSTPDEQFARTFRHELAHVNGWPATHGD